MTDWATRYASILETFGWSEADDRASADALRRLLPRDGFRHVGTELKHRPVVSVVGCGPALETLRASDLAPGVVVAADGATSRLREIGVTPRIVVTDLDGPMDGLQWAADQGASMVVHAHGDNADKLDHVEQFPLAAGTYQCMPDSALAPLRNLEGFTDGDRAVRLCETFGVKQVHLVAFEFDAPPSRYSGSWDPTTKPRKLGFAHDIIAEVQLRGTTRVVGLTPNP